MWVPETSSHVTRPADTRGAARRAGRAVGRCGSRLSRGGGVVVRERPGRGCGVAGDCCSGAANSCSTAAACRWLMIRSAVEEFAADGADEAFGDRVGPRCPHRCLDDPDVDGGEDGVERGGELGVAVADEEPEAAAGVVEVHEQVAGLLGEPGAGGVGGDAEDVHAAGGVLDDEERVEPVQGDGVEVEQVAGEDRVSLGAQELRSRIGPARRGEGSMPAVCRMVQTVEAPIW